MKMFHAAGFAVVFATAFGCLEAESEIPTFEQFEAQTYRMPESGIYVVDGDLPIRTREELRAFYDRMIASMHAPSGFSAGAATSASPLIVNLFNGSDDKWNDTQRISLTYCVSTGFGGSYNQVVQAMHDAASAWEQAAAINFIHVPAQDTKCTNTNLNVTFNVVPYSGGFFAGAAFFPSWPREYRNLYIDWAAFGQPAPFTITGLLRHELGHVLGFRHEHTRPESGVCFEDTNWRALTPYDSASVMHYPQCRGTNTFALELTSRDREGVALLYPGFAFNSIFNLTDSGQTPQANNDSWTQNEVGQSFAPPYPMLIQWVDVCAYGTFAPATAVLRDGPSAGDPVLAGASSIVDTGENCGWAGSAMYRWRRAFFPTTVVGATGRQYSVSFYNGGGGMGLTINDSRVISAGNTNIPYSGGMMWDMPSGRSAPTWDLNVRMGVEPTIFNLTDSGQTPRANNDAWTQYETGQSFISPYRMLISWVDVCAFGTFAPSTAVLRNGATTTDPVLVNASSIVDTGESCGWAGSALYRWRRAFFPTSLVFEGGRPFNVSFYNGGGGMGLTINDSRVTNPGNTNIPYSGGTFWDTFTVSRPFPTWDMNVRMSIIPVR